MSIDSHLEAETIDDRLEDLRHENSGDSLPGMPLARELPGESDDESLSDEPMPVTAKAGAPDPIPAYEQSQETTEVDSPERAFHALSVPPNVDELLTVAGSPLEGGEAKFMDVPGRENGSLLE